MNTINVKKELSKFDKKQLIEIIMDISKKHQVVSDYLEYFFNPNEKQQFDKYKQQVFEAFYPKRGYELKLKNGKQAMADFKKLDPSNLLLADLMLYYVECGVAFTKEFGDINEAFYTSIEKGYLRAMKFMNQEGLLDEFKKRCHKVLDDSQDTGWGFHESLADVYYEYFSFDTEEEDKA